MTPPAVPQPEPGPGPGSAGRDGRDGLEDRFALLVNIVRATHFEWLETALAFAPAGTPAGEILRRYWEIVGRDTAAAYVRRIAPDRPLAPQVTALMAESSCAMGEDAIGESGATPTEAFLRHRACPWYAWHRRRNLADEDRPGCDRWFAATLEGVNAALGSDLRFATLSAIPDGGPACVRRIWVERELSRLPHG